MPYKVIGRVVRNMYSFLMIETSLANRRKVKV